MAIIKKIITRIRWDRILHVFLMQCNMVQPGSSSVFSKGLSTPLLDTHTRKRKWLSALRHACNCSERFIHHGPKVQHRPMSIHQWEWRDEMQHIYFQCCRMRKVWRAVPQQREYITEGYTVNDMASYTMECCLAIKRNVNTVMTGQNLKNTMLSESQSQRTICYMALIIFNA